MGWYNWEDYRPRPIRPARGIKAQAQRGKFGKSWWADRWVHALEQLVDPGRLARGRSYARSGQVVKLDAGREGVDALVQGSRRTPYHVRIRFRALSDAEWDRVIDAMAAQALYAAKLLSGEMPAEIEEVFAEAGVPLFPADAHDLETDCSCPDWSNPCKHVAAVHYLLGERFDANPFLIFELRGRDKESIIAALRAHRADGLPPESEAPSQESTPENEPVVPLEELLDSFWTAPTGASDIPISFETPRLGALPIRRLGTPVFWEAERDLLSIMGETYTCIGVYARRVAMGEE
ncbi:MAG: hypothetical protein EPO21_22540 [Chloroflexota bacterium]|nr:MAG: hypothetical protein EPO21_22540 [Chloroflexota bacterium]